MLSITLLCNFLQPTITSHFFGPNILLNTLFSNTISLCSSLNVTHQVSYPYKTAGKMMVSYVSILSFWIAGEKLNGSELNGSKH
jgi:hypothetical protein